MSREKDRHVGAASRALVEALHALLCPTTGNLAQAILSTSIALLEMAKADPEQKALGILVPVLRDAQKRRREGTDGGREAEL